MTRLDTTKFGMGLHGMGGFNKGRTELGAGCEEDPVGD